MNQDRITSMKHIFAYLFMVARKWEQIGDREYGKDGLTLKQVMTLIVMENGFDGNPTLMDISRVMGTSHQNVKVMITTLKNKGFVTTYTDEIDRRKTRVRTNKTKEIYWKNRKDRDIQILEGLFSGIPDEDLSLVRQAIEACDATASEILSSTE